MNSTLPRIEFPEIFLGLVAPIGADLTATIDSFRVFFESEGYQVVHIKVTDVFRILSRYIIPKTELINEPSEERYKSFISYGNQLRDYFEDDSILAAATIIRVIQKRTRIDYESDGNKFSKTVFILDQFKRREEIDLLRTVYGRLFFQVSLYSRRGARVDELARQFASSANSGNNEKFRTKAEEIAQQDQNEEEEEHGQRVAGIFHEADFILNIDIKKPSINDQIHRFFELIFSSNCISPTKMEYGMFAAKAAALRTLDLSRQVGAAIFSNRGEIISLGSNEVPQAGGGTYWPDGDFDDRDYVRNQDSNDVRKVEILAEIAGILGCTDSANELVKINEIKNSQLMDSLEYGRIVHAEMSAICDAGRTGRPLLDCTMYCTTFPCHMCAKHIVAAGLAKVIFLEPYPKSLAQNLHSDALEIEGAERGKFKEYPAVKFEHFFGISPRRYREFFERRKRKNEKGELLKYMDNVKRPFIDIKYPLYASLEGQILDTLGEVFKDKFSQDHTILDDPPNPHPSSAPQ